MAQPSQSNSHDMLDKLLKAVGKFDGSGFEKWKSDALGTISMRRPEVFHIIDGRPCPEPKPFTRRGRSLVRTMPPDSADEAQQPDPPAASRPATRSRATAAAAEDTTADDSAAGTPPTQPVQQQLTFQTADATSPPSTNVWYIAPATATSIPRDSSDPVDVSSSILWTDDNSISNLEDIRDWHRDNTFLADFLYMATTGAPRTFVNKFREKPGILSNGIEAWRGLIKKYQNHTRVRKDILVKKFRAMTMEEDEDPEVFFLRLADKRNELSLLGKVIDDDDVLTIILDQLPPFYDRVKYQAESQEDFDLDEAMIVMRNMHANRIEEDGRASRSAKGRSSAMAAYASKFCTYCKKKGHEERNCFKKNKKKPAGHTPGGRNGDWCTLHNTSRHDNSNCREQQQNNTGSNGRQQQGRHRGQGQRNNNNNGRRRNQGGQQYRGNNGGNQNGNFNGNSNGGNYNNGNQQQAHFGQLVPAPSSTTMVDAYNPAGQHPPGSATALSAPPSGVGFSFLASHTNPEPISFAMTVDTGASSHFLDTDLLPDITNHMIEHTKIDPPLIIDVAGKGQLHGTTMGALKVNVSDHQGCVRPIRLPFISVPNLGRHLFSGGTAMKHGVGVLFTPQSPCLDMGAFKIPVQPDASCDTLFHFNLAIAPDSVATQHAFTTISGLDLPRGRANVTVVQLPASTAATTGSTTASSGHTAFTAVKSAKASANIWHKRLGHPSVQVMEKLARTEGSGVHLQDSFSACSTCPINKSTKNDQPKTAPIDVIPERLQVISTDLIGPISPPAIGGYSYMSKFTDYRTRIKAVYFIKNKNEALSTFVNFNRDVAVPLGLRVHRVHSDNGKEYVNREFRDYCKTIGVVQSFTAPHTPQQNGISERDGRTIMNMTRCLLHEARLPKQLWGEIAATSVFLINRLPHKALKGDTPYYHLFGKQADLSFLRVIGSRAFVHVEGHTTKLQPKAWEGVLVGYNDDSPTFRVYNRETKRLASSRNVIFIEEPQAVLPPAEDAPDDPDFDVGAEPDSPDEDIINTGISLLEDTDTTPVDTTSNAVNSGSSPATQDPRAGKISSRLRSSANMDPPQPDGTNPRQTRALRQLNFATIAASQGPLDSYTEYIGAVGMDNVLPPAAVEVPNTYKQAMASPQATQWEKAMRKELDSLNDHEVADLIPFSSVPAGYSVIGTRWVYRVKTDGRFKARVVVQGWAQQHGIDCFTTFAPVCRISSQRLLLAIAASHGWPVVAMDVQTAFLNGTLSEDVYTKQAPGFEKIDDNTGKPYVWKLRKSLYGLRQSPSVWNLTIDKDLRRKGFTPSASDPCVYTKGSGDTYIMLTLFVDDLLLTGPSQQVLHDIRRELQRSFAMTDMGEATQILGIDIKQDLANGTITLSQERYTLSVLKRYKMDTANPVNTPATPVDFQAAETSPLLSETAKKEYQSAVGSLIFLINATRFDVAFATMQAARYMSKPREAHLGLLKRIFRYLRRRPALTLQYRRTSRFALTCYSDAAYATTQDYKSVTGSMVFLAGGLIHFGSQVQRITATSSSEAEIIALSTTAKHGMYFSSLLGELGWSKLLHFTLLTDNRSALSLISTGNFSNRSRHIAVRYAAIRNWVTTGRIKLDHVPTSEMLSDYSPNHLSKTSW